MATQVKVEDPRATDALFEALKLRARERKGGELVRVTRADAVALTGMPSEQAEPALKSLVKTYRSHMAVTDDGELVYAFDPALERRDQVPLGERLAAAGALAWRGFSFLFKIWIVVTLVFYVIAFLAMMISLLVVRSGSDRDDDRGGGFGLPWIWFWMFPDLAHDPYGRPVRRRRMPQKRFYQSVFDFVFGPKTALVDPREAEKRLIAFLRAHKGRVTAAELVALSGMSLDAADEELTLLMASYDGEVEVADDGTLIYNFEHLLTTAGAVEGRWSWDWDRAEPVETLTGNTKGTNGVIGAFAGFNLLASVSIGPAFLARTALAFSAAAWWVVTIFPLIFSALFFAIPTARLIRHRRKQRRNERRRLRRALLAEIWARPDELRDPDELSRRAAERAKLPKAEARALLEKLLVELDGDVDNDPSGAVRYKFPRLDQERKSVAAAREKVVVPTLGPVEFSSED
jgi:hypothetical protein